MTQSTETVSQRAREAAAQRLERNAKDIPDHPMRGTAQMIRDGKLDGHSWVKEFARFEREVSTNKDETIAKLREALDRCLQIARDEQNNAKKAHREERTNAGKSYRNGRHDAAISIGTLIEGVISRAAPSSPSVNSLVGDGKHLTRLIEQARSYVMTPAEIEAQRQSFIRGMAPCEHGDPDWETCPHCLAKYAKQDQSHA